MLMFRPIWLLQSAGKSVNSGSGKRRAFYIPAASQGRLQRGAISPRSPADCRPPPSTPYRAGWRRPRGSWQIRRAWPHGPAAGARQRGPAGAATGDSVAGRAGPRGYGAVSSHRRAETRRSVANTASGPHVATQSVSEVGPEMVGIELNMPIGTAPAAWGAARLGPRGPFTTPFQGVPPVRGVEPDRPHRLLSRFAPGVTVAMLGVTSASALPSAQAMPPKSTCWNRGSVHTFSRWPIDV